MVNYQPLSETFRALGDPTRRAVIEGLAKRGVAPVSELAAEHRMSLPAFLKHVRLLERAGLLTTSKVGRVRYCRLVPLPLEQAEVWIQSHRAFWEAQLASLDRYLRDPITDGED
jgi:DNA-binding transcriptional ArsR family regulator